jgi:hypothetical protein
MANVCEFTCIDGTFVLTGGNPGPGFFCPGEIGECSVNGSTKRIPALPIPDDPSASLRALNEGLYVYHAGQKKLLFQGGNCDEHRHFVPELTVKELAKWDPDSAKLVKDLRKNKKVANFSVVVKARKIKRVAATA